MLRKSPLLLGFYVILMALVVPASAFPHAVTTGAVPNDESTVKEPIKEVKITFNENVAIAFGGARAWGPSGERVDNGEAQVVDGVNVVIPLSVKEQGTYAVSYRIVSADGHPVRGALTFHYKSTSATASSEEAALDSVAGNRPVEFAVGASRALGLMGLMILAGGVAFSAVIAPGVRARYLSPAALAAAVGVGASFFLDAMNATGLSVTDVFQAKVIAAEAVTPWGRSALIQLVLIVVVALWLRVKDPSDVRSFLRGFLVMLPAFAPILIWSMGGHAIAGKPVWLRLPLDMIHMVAAALWIGGIVQLNRYLRDGAVSAEHVERFSRMAVGAVTALVLTGLYASWQEIGLSMLALTGTTYGYLVLAKVILLLVIAPLAWINQRRFVPALRDGSLGSDARLVQTRMRSYVRGEVALLVLVIVATAALIQTQPARTVVDPGFHSEELEMPKGGMAQIVVDPARAGDNELHVYVSNDKRRIDDTVTNVELVADGPRGIENLPMNLIEAGPGHFMIPSRTIPFSGSWEFKASIHRGKFDVDSATFTVRIGEKKK